MKIKLIILFSYRMVKKKIFSALFSVVYLFVKNNNNLDPGKTGNYIYK